MREPETREVPFPSAWVTLADAMAYFDQWQGSLGLAGDFRRILYGTDEPCMECETSGVGSPPADGRPYGPVCPTCHELRGTGRIKTPGLVERWMLFLCYAAGVAGEDARAPDEFRPVLVGDVLEFLRREIGEV